VGARERMRGLIDEILLEPHGARLGVVLKGTLAGMLRLARNNKRPSEPTTSWTKYSWLRGLATSGICSCGAGRHSTSNAAVSSLVAASRPPQSSACR
jgi:hypothetical protein